MKKVLILVGCLLFFWSFSQLSTKNNPLQKEGFLMPNEATTIAFPLRGEWYTETSPADRVPSHGTNRFGLRYAFDFIQKDKNDRSHTANSADYLLGGIPLENYYCFGQPVYAPFNGEVITVKNNTSDGEKASWLHDQITAIRHSLFSIQNETASRQSPEIISSSNKLPVSTLLSVICKRVQLLFQKENTLHKEPILATSDILEIPLSRIYIFN